MSLAKNNSDLCALYILENKLTKFSKLNSPHFVWITLHICKILNTSIGVLFDFVVVVVVNDIKEN